MDEKSLKKRIREIREELRLTQEEFAQELGIDSSTYWRLEDGRTRIISPYLYKIAEYAGLSIEELIVGKQIAKALEESQDYREKIESQRKFYESLLEEKDATIRNLNNYINTLQK
ncbi:MAG: helix-turn-helix domain-containing protein [Candidatus Cryptobacteroides sp.]|jgi:transcriptional regulator with XRE-family HTH domain